MNKLGSAGHPVPGSFLTPDAPEETTALANARKAHGVSEEISAENMPAELAGKPQQPDA